MATVLAVVVAAIPSAAHAQSPSDPPYALPAPTLTVVSTLELPRPQTLHGVLRDGMRLLLRAYKPVSLTVSVALAPATAKRLALRGSRTLAMHSYKFTNPGSYDLRVRLTRAVRRLARIHQATFLLHATLQGATGTAASTSRIVLHD